MGKNAKWIWMITAILATAGGAELLLSGFFGYSLFSNFGTWANWVAGASGVGTLWYVIKKQWM